MGDFNSNFDKRRSRGSRGRDSGRFNRGRSDRPDRHSGGFDRGGRGRDRRSERQEMHSAICDKCGKDCEVPFKPTQGKPLYCNDCFKDKGREAGSRSESVKPINNENFDQINKKLDKILKILETAKEPVEEKPELKKPKKIEEEPPDLEEPKSTERKKPKKRKKKS